MKLPFRTILCPTDLTAAGDDAVAVAYSLAAPGATVHLLHVMEPALVASPIDMTPVMLGVLSPDVLQAMETKATTHLKRLVPEEALVRGVHTDTHVLQEIDAAGVIQREAKRLGADVIVAGTHGRKGASVLLMGSVATHLVRHASAPVILVRPCRP